MQQSIKIIAFRRAFEPHRKLFLVTWTASSWRGTLNVPSSVKLAGIGQEYSEVVTWNPPPSHLPAQAAAFEETPKTIQDSEPNYMVQTQTVLKAKTQ